MKTKTVVILILLGLVAILLLQNSGLTQLRLFFWNVYAPLFVLLLVFFFVGGVVGYLAAHRDRKKDQKKDDEKLGPPVLPPPSPAKPHA
jgi:uncharacterized integral membrane protein